MAGHERQVAGHEPSVAGYERPTGPPRNLRSSPGTGCCGVTYYVQAIRSTAVGEEETHNVSFGSTFRVNTPGQMQIAA